MRNLNQEIQEAVTNVKLEPDFNIDDYITGLSFDTYGDRADGRLRELMFEINELIKVSPDSESAIKDALHLLDLCVHEEDVYKEGATDTVVRMNLVGYLTTIFKYHNINTNFHYMSLWTPQ